MVPSAICQFRLLRTHPEAWLNAHSIKAKLQSVTATIRPAPTPPGKARMAPRAHQANPWGRSLLRADPVGDPRICVSFLKFGTRADFAEPHFAFQVLTDPDSRAAASPAPLPQAPRRLPSRYRTPARRVHTCILSTGVLS